MKWFFFFASFLAQKKKKKRNDFCRSFHVTTCRWWVNMNTEVVYEIHRQTHTGIHNTYYIGIVTAFHLLAVSV